MGRLLKVSWRFVGGVMLALAAAGILYVLLAPERPSLSRGEFEDAGYAEYRPGGSRCDPARLRALEGRQALVEQDRCEDAAEEYRLKREDLVQQTRSAEAEEAVADLTYGQSQLMAAGTAIGFLTLVAAVFAVLYARNAAYEARRGSTAAEGQLQEAGRVTAAELRPYLFIDRLEMEITNPTPYRQYRVMMVFRNYGKLPARSLRIRHDCYFTDQFELRKTVFRSRVIEIPVCAPGHERKAFTGAQLSVADQEIFDKGIGELIVRVRFSYKGDGPKRYREEADYVYDRSSVGTGHFYILSQGSRKRRQENRLELLEYLERAEQAARNSGEDA